MIMIKKKKKQDLHCQQWVIFLVSRATGRRAAGLDDGLAHWGAPGGHPTLSATPFSSIDDWCAGNMPHSVVKNTCPPPPDLPGWGWVSESRFVITRGWLDHSGRKSSSGKHSGSGLFSSEYYIYYFIFAKFPLISLLNFIFAKFPPFFFLFFWMTCLLLRGVSVTYLPQHCPVQQSNTRESMIEGLEVQMPAPKYPRVWSVLVQVWEKLKLKKLKLNCLPVGLDSTLHGSSHPLVCERVSESPLWSTWTEKPLQSDAEAQSIYHFNLKKLYIIY